MRNTRKFVMAEVARKSPLVSRFPCVFAPFALGVNFYSTILTQRAKDAETQRLQPVKRCSGGRINREIREIRERFVMTDGWHPISKVHVRNLHST
jgi:hypothetical protein